MNISNIENIVSNYEPKTEKSYKYSAVLIPLINIDGEYHLLYEVRSFDLKSQPGDICFPGGKTEEGETGEESAIRETMEELNLNRDQIRIMGEVDTIMTPFNLIIRVFVGELINVSVEDINYSKDEVEDVFTVPLHYLLNNEPREYIFDSQMIIPEDFPIDKVYNGENYNWRRGKYPTYIYEYDNYFIWGMTARMTLQFTELFKGE